MENFKNNLAMVWSIASILFIAYILVFHGEHKEILTLIIGLIGGTVLGGIFGVYFGGTHKDKPLPTDPPTAVTVTNNPTEPIPVEEIKP